MKRYGVGVLSVNISSLSQTMEEYRTKPAIAILFTEAAVHRCSLD